MPLQAELGVNHHDDQPHGQSESFFTDLHLTWIIHEKCKEGRKKSLKQCRIKLFQTFSVSIVP
jgi:hypothetical protein